MKIFPSKTQIKQNNKVFKITPTIIPKTRNLESKLYKAIRYFLIVCEIFMSAPFGVHRPQQNIDTFRDRIWNSLHITWCFVIYAALTFCIYIHYTESNIDLPTVQKPLYFSEYIVYLVHVLQIIIGSYYGRHKFQNFLNIIINFDEQITVYNVYPNFKLFRKFLNKHLLLILLHTILTTIIDFYYSSSIVLNFLYSTIVYVLPNNILHISLLQYYGLLYAIALRANNLNQILSLKLSKKSLDPSTLHEDLHISRSLYSTLEQLYKSVNDSFAQSVLLVYIGSFMNISINIFLIYKYMDKVENSDLAWTLYSVIWTFMHIGKMFLILYYNHCIQKEKNNTALLLNDIYVENEEIEETITHFVLQLVVNTRSNVACGVAELNMNFITSLLVAISTLFIFLLQYDITFEALTKSHNSASPRSQN